MGKPCSEETRKKISLARSRPKIKVNCKICKKDFKVVPHKITYGVKYCSDNCRIKGLKGKPSWNLGNKGFRAGEKRPNIIPKGEKSTCWKGEKVGYGGIHMWMRKEFGPAKNYICMFCGHDGKKHRIEWANLSGRYIRHGSDWTTLCKKCHAAFDKFKRQMIK